MKKVKNIIIGFGKGGKTLGKALAQRDEEVLVIEASDQMYGGTCINIGCIPSKSMILNGEKGTPFTEAVAIRGDLTSRLRNKNYHMIADEATGEVWTGTATFMNDHQLQVKMLDGSTQEVIGERIFINTGAKPVIPNISGLALSQRIVTSTEAMTLAELPRELVILGSGYIGLEFAAMFASYGTKVTVLDTHKAFIPREDDDIAAMIYQDLVNLGITFHLGVDILSVAESEQVTVTYQDGVEQKISGDALLVATGRTPNTANLGLEHTAVKLDERGAIVVDDQLRAAENIWALGDVKGGLQFTYISLDDYRIVMDQLFGAGTRRVSDRTIVPYTVFLTPPLSNVGLTEKQAKAQDLDYKVFKFMTANVPKAQVLEDPKGMFKILVGPDERIIGASIYAEESHEIINLVALAMKADLSYTVLRDMIYTHPTMAEAFNDVLK